MATTTHQRTPLTLATATEALATVADRRIVQLAQQLLDAGEAEWVWDPQVPNVLGLVVPGTTTAWLVLYPYALHDHLDDLGVPVGNTCPGGCHDFEVANRMEQRLGQ